MGLARSGEIPQGESKNPLVGVIMGSRTDWDVMRHACEVLEKLGVPYETKVVSAHRTPDGYLNMRLRRKAGGWP